MLFFFFFSLRYAACHERHATLPLLFSLPRGDAAAASAQRQRYWRHFEMLAPAQRYALFYAARFRRLFSLMLFMLLL